MGTVFLAKHESGECRETVIEANGGGGGGGDLKIAASVGVNGRNLRDDVLTIQKALNKVSPPDGGPLPPLAEDGWIGQYTNTAITKFQKHHFGWADGRVDPGQKTITKLREYQGVAPPGKASGGSGGAGTVTPDPVTLAQFYAQIEEAKRWINAAQHKLQRARDFVVGLGSFGGGGAEAFALVNKYFHLDKEPKAVVPSRLMYLEGVFQAMKGCIAHSSPMTQQGTGYFQEDPTPGNNPKGKVLAYTYYGGYTRRKKNGEGPPMSKDDNYKGANLRQDTVFVVTHVLKKWQVEMYTATLVHELAHFCGPEIDKPDRIGDHSYRGQPNFLKLSPLLAARTAECYNEFAGESYLHREPNYQHIPGYVPPS
jgi:hypothetical protein